MRHFNRIYTPIDFGENDNSPIEIVLKYKDDFEGLGNAMTITHCVLGK